MKIILEIFKIHLQTIYFFIKIFTRQRNRVFFLSRQTNHPPLNYNLLINYISKYDKNIEIRVSCKRVSEGLNKVIHSSEKNLRKWIPSLLKEVGQCFDYYFTLYKQMYYMATSKVVITDGYNVLISCLKHKKITIIQMWHALAAIKKFGYQSIGLKDGMNPKMAKVLNMHANYDYVLSGSVAMKRPFSEAFNIAEDKVLPIGTPYIDYLLDVKVDKRKIFHDYPELKNGKPIILYSPTFRKNGRDAIKEVIDGVDTSKYNLVVTLHALDVLKAYNTNNGSVIVNPKINYPELLKMADYVITDYSALMIEAAILKTNILLYVYDYEQYEEENGLNVNLFEELPGYASREIQDLMKIIDENKYDRKVMLNFRKKFVTNLTKDSTEKIYNLIKGELKC